MSGYYPSPPDTTTLPAALLPTVKAHCRVEFTRDDAQITNYTGEAISLLQQKWGLQVFGVDYAWTPEPSGQSRYQCPVLSVSDFVVMSGGIDVSADYRLEMSSSLTEPAWLARIDGTAFPADAAVMLNAGYATPGAIPPDMLSIILRKAATLYESREAVTSPVQQMPEWDDDLLVGLWVPRC